MTTSFDEQDWLDALRTYLTYQLYTARTGYSKINVYMLDSLDEGSIDWTIMKDSRACVCFKDSVWEDVKPIACEIMYPMEFLCCVKIFGNEFYGESITGRAPTTTSPGIVDITQALHGALDPDNIIYDTSNSISMTNNILQSSIVTGADASITVKVSGEGGIENKIQTRRLTAHFQLRNTA